MATKKTQAVPNPVIDAFAQAQDQFREAGELMLETSQKAWDQAFYFRARFNTAATDVVKRNLELATQEQATVLDAIDQFASQAAAVQSRLQKTAQSFQA